MCITYLILSAAFSCENIGEEASGKKWAIVIHSGDFARLMEIGSGAMTSLKLVKHNMCTE